MWSPNSSPNCLPDVVFQVSSTCLPVASQMWCRNCLPTVFQLSSTCLAVVSQMGSLSFFSTCLPLPRLSQFSPCVFSFLAALNLKPSLPSLLLGCKAGLMCLSTYQLETLKLPFKCCTSTYNLAVAACHSRLQTAREWKNVSLLLWLRLQHRTGVASCKGRASCGV